MTTPRLAPEFGSPASISAALEKFLGNIAGFSALFAAPAKCDRELALRSLMRQTMSELAFALTDAAQHETLVPLAKRYRTAAVSAAKLSGSRASRRSAN